MDPLSLFAANLVSQLSTHKANAHAIVENLRGLRFWLQRDLLAWDRLQAIMTHQEIHSSCLANKIADFEQVIGDAHWTLRRIETMLRDIPDDDFSRPPTP